MTFLYLVMALLGAAATLFAVQNIDPVVIRFLGWRVEGMPLALVILISLMVGVVFASLSGFMRTWRLRSRIRQLENQLVQLRAAVPPASQSAQASRTDPTVR